MHEVGAVRRGHGCHPRLCQSLKPREHALHGLLDLPPEMTPQTGKYKSWLLTQPRLPLFLKWWIFFDIPIRWRTRSSPGSVFHQGTLQETGGFHGGTPSAGSFSWIIPIYPNLKLMITGGTPMTLETSILRPPGKDDHEFSGKINNKNHPRPAESHCSPVPCYWPRPSRDAYWRHIHNLQYTINYTIYIYLTLVWDIYSVWVWIYLYE